MTKLSIIGLGLILLYSCNAKITDSLVNTSQMNQLTKYEYDYKQGKKSLMITKDYTIMFGVVVDTMITRTLFLYNKKGQIIKEISYTNTENKPDFKLYDYNSNDSLISEISINSDGDTMNIVRYGYFLDGKKIIYRRDLWLLDQTNDLITTYKNKIFDTILFSREYLYENDVCKQLKEYDKNKKLSNEIIYSYKNNKIFKEDYYTYYDTLRMFDKTMIYDYSKSEKYPDSYSLNETSDTIDFTNNIFNAKEKIASINSYKKGNTIVKSFYKNGKEIEIICIDKEMNHKMVISNTYYENGEIKEDKSYSEKINAR